LGLLFFTLFSSWLLSFHSQSFAGQLAGLLHPAGEPGFVEGDLVNI
jgi:hypothetical protein